MKCMTNGKEVVRVGDRTAQDMSKDGWDFCPKRIWKEYKKTGKISEK